MLNLSTFLTRMRVYDVPFDSEFQIHYSFNVFGETKIAMNMPFKITLIVRLLGLVSNCHSVC